MIDPVRVIVIKKPAYNLVPFFRVEIFFTILELIALNFFDCNFRICSFEAQVAFESIVQYLKFGTLIVVQTMRLPGPRLCFYFELRHFLVSVVADNLIIVRLSCTHY